MLKMLNLIGDGCLRVDNKRNNIASLLHCVLLSLLTKSGERVEMGEGGYVAFCIVVEENLCYSRFFLSDF